MEWVILFCASWILLIALVDLKALKVNIWAGFYSILMQLLIDAIAMYHGLYEIRKLIIPHLFGSSVFFTFGPVFVIGTLMAQYHPAKRGLAIINVLILTVLYSCQELFLVFAGCVVYTGWHFHDSLYVNIVVMTSISWFIVFILDKRKLA